MKTALILLIALFGVAIASPLHKSFGRRKASMKRTFQRREELGFCSLDPPRLDNYTKSGLNEACELSGFGYELQGLVAVGQAYADLGDEDSAGMVEAFKFLFLDGCFAAQKFTCSCVAPAFWMEVAMAFSGHDLESEDFNMEDFGVEEFFSMLVSGIVMESGVSEEAASGAVAAMFRCGFWYHVYSDAMDFGSHEKFSSEESFEKPDPEEVQDKLEEVADKLPEIADKLPELVDEIQDKLPELADEIQDKLPEMPEAVADKMQDKLAGLTKESLRRLLSAFSKRR